MLLMFIYFMRIEREKLSFKQQPVYINFMVHKINTLRISLIVCKLGHVEYVDVRLNLNTPKT